MNQKIHTKSDRRIVLIELLRVILGLMVFSYGVHLIIAADIGVAPWDCLGQGIANHTPLNYGMAMTVVSICVLALDLLLRQPIGYGILFDTFLTGNMIQFCNDHCGFSNGLISMTLQLDGLGAILASCLMICVGLVFMAVGQVIYIGAGQSCGPRDTLTVGLGQCFPKVPIGLIQNSILLVVFVAGWLLGGSVGVGTLLGVFGTGIVMQVVFGIMHFEPREVRHRSFAETTRMLVYGKTP